MDVDTLLNLLFILGMIVQLALILRHRLVESVKALTTILIISTLLCSCTLFSEDGTSAFFPMFFITFSLFSVVWFRKDILPVISEGTLLVLTMVYWYLAFNYPLLLWCLPFFPLFAAFTLGTVILSFTDIRIGGNLRAFFYIWFMIMAFSIALVQFAYLIPFNPMDKAPSELDPYTSFVVGMSFFYLFAYGFYLIDLLPLSKYKTLDQRISELKEYMELLNTKYSAAQLNPWLALALIVFLGGLLALNLAFGLVNDMLLIGIFIVISQALSPEAFRH